MGDRCGVKWCGNPIFMNRSLLLALLAVPSLTAYAQVVTSVQDGAWSDPATWDCTCVPSMTSSVVVLHHVTLSAGLAFGPSLTIAPGGHIEKNAPGYVGCLQPCSLNVAGLFSSTGYLALGTPVELSGTITAFDVYFAGNVTMTGGTVQVTGNFTTAAGMTVDGYGQICAGDSTNIQGPLTGTIDICDQTPTTLNPPYVDGGASFVGPGITFCQGQACTSGTGSLEEAPGYDVVFVGRDYLINGPVREVMLTDIGGRQCEVRTTVSSGSTKVEPRTAAPGLYVLSFRTADGWRSLRVVRY